MQEEKRRKKWERVFLSWNASNFSHAPNSLLPLRQARRIKSPKKRRFSSKLDFLFLRWKISALPLLDPLPVKSLRNEKAFTKTAVSLLIEMSEKKSFETAMVKSNDKKTQYDPPPDPSKLTIVINREDLSFSPSRPERCVTIASFGQ